MDSRIILFSVALSWLVPVAGMAQAQAPSNTAEPDATFEDQLLRTLHQINLTEITAGRLAMARGTTGAIQQYGADMVTDHRSADNQLIALAAKLNVTLPAAAPEDDSLKQLTTLQGDAFDRAFVRMMWNDTTKAVSLVKEAKKRVSNPSVADFLTQLRPTLEKHLEVATTLSKSS